MDKLLNIITRTKVIILTLLFLFLHVFNAYSNKIPDFSELAEELLPSVVSISVMLSNEPSVQGIPQFPPGSPFDEFFKDFFERRGGVPRQRRNETAMGSGFIVDSEGLIVTNNHVIANSDKITIVLHNGTSLQAKLLGSDPKTDIALLKVEPEKPLKAVAWGDSDNIKVGNWALAIGNPFGLVNTVTLGIVSAIARDIKAGPFDDFIQTDAPINRGNSGGPLFNLKGEVIGINTAIYSPSGGSVGIGFAVPSTLAKSVVEQLRDHGKTIRGWLGVRIQSITPDIAESLGLSKVYGALVASIIPDSPAEKANIKVGDVIIGFNGSEVTEMRRLPRLVAETEVNKPVEIVVWRDNKEIRFFVIIAEMKEENMATNKNSSNNEEENPETFQALGLSISNLTNDLKNQQNIPEKLKGLFVLDVEQNSDSERKGIRPGDIIVEAEQQVLNSLLDFKNILKKLRDLHRKSVLLLINRGGNLTFIAVILD